MRTNIAIKSVKRPLAILAAFGLSAVVMAARDKSEDLKQRILAHPQSTNPDDYAFTRTVRTEGATPSTDELGRYKKETSKRRVPGYHRLPKYFGAASTVSTAAQGRTVFHSKSLPKDTALVFDTDVSQNTSAQVTIGEANGTAFAEQVRLSVKPMRLKLLMKLDRYESTARYHLGPEGKPQLVEHVADLSGSGLGQEGSAHTVATYTDYRFVGKSP